MTTHEFLDAKRKNKVHQCSLLTEVLYFFLTDLTLLIHHSPLPMMVIILLISSDGLGCHSMP
jgi:hypothetical protein